MIVEANRPTTTNAIVRGILVARFIGNFLCSTKYSTARSFRDNNSCRFRSNWPATASSE